MSVPLPFAVTLSLFTLVNSHGVATMIAAQANQHVDPLRGKTVKWTMTDDDPKKVATYEHVFYDDGTVEWRALEGPFKGHSAREKAYSATAVAEHVIALSYLAASGYTLTVVLNTSSQTLIGYASGNGEWVPLKGTFEIVR